VAAQAGAAVEPMLVDMADAGSIGRFSEVGARHPNPRDTA
jgi:hypothetical protein